jgi:LDH2 family malate/lactate/ureidoglycolate dehydrogenase
VMAQSPEYVAPHAGTEALFGTNPIAVGVPKGLDPPFVFDMATSGLAYYDVVAAWDRGDPLPPGLAYNAAGDPTTNPAEVLEGGALRPFDRHALFAWRLVGFRAGPISAHPALMWTVASGDLHT